MNTLNGHIYLGLFLLEKKQVMSKKKKVFDRTVESCQHLQNQLPIFLEPGIYLKYTYFSGEFQPRWLIVFTFIKKSVQEF